MALLPFPDFPLTPKPVHQNRAPHLLPSTPTHSFPTSRGESRYGVSVTNHWLTSLFQTSGSRTYSFVCCFPPVHLWFPPSDYEQEHAAEDRESWVWYRHLHPNHLTVHSKRKESTSDSHLHKAMYQLSVKRHKSACLQPAELSFAHKGPLKPLQDPINKQKL